MSQTTNHPRLEMAPVGDLKPDPKSPRKHSAKQIEMIMQSIRRLGFRGALLVDEENMIIAGVARWLAAKKLGLEEVPVSIAA